MRKFLSITCGVCFFGATLVNILKGVSLGSSLSFISGTAFFLGTVMDHHDIFQHVEADKEPKDPGANEVL